MERFTRRSSSKWASERGCNAHVKIIDNPRKIKLRSGVHCSIYFEGFHAINEEGNVVVAGFNYPVTVDKVVINHYHCKSLEEYRGKKIRGIATHVSGPNYSDAQFRACDRNEEFDDGILKYREARAKVYQPLDNSHVEERLLSALERNLSRQTNDIETLLTCRAVAAYLKEKTYEEAALKATLQALANAPSVAAKELFKQELPKLLELPYPVVEELSKL